MLNKKNAAYAVFGFALVGCNNVLAGCDCCKGVPKELENFTVIFKNLKGVTYATLDQYFKKENGKDEILGKDLIEKKIANNSHNLTEDLEFYIVNCDEKKNEMKVYAKSDATTMKSNYSSDAEKKCKLIKIKLEKADGKSSTITDDGKYKVESVSVGQEIKVSNAAA